MKTLLNVDEMINHLKNKGVKFNILNEEKAKEFLINSNYYLKLGSYRANYEKIDNGNKKGQYRNLDFAYLVELSKLDMYLRYIIIEMCLDIEHSLKVILLNKIENNPNDDGYELTRRFVGKYSNILESIKRHKSSEYCKKLIEKYYPYFPIWVFVEVITFGDLRKLCWFYEDVYGDKILEDARLLNSVRDLRNAAAHNNCLLNKLGIGKNIPLHIIFNYVKNIDGISSVTRNKKLRNKFIYDFTTLIYVYDKIVKSKLLKEKRLNQLNDLLNSRFNKNIEYFKDNDLITSTFNYMKKVVDNVM